MFKSTVISETGSETVFISDYDYGRPGVAHPPVSIQELRQIESTVGWSEDAKVLQRNRDVFRNNVEHTVDAWRALIAAQPHLAELFVGPDGKRDEEYAAKVKKRFVQWVMDACVRPHDQAWLDYQEEIGLRHAPEKKDRTDGAHTPALVPPRYPNRIRCRHNHGDARILIATGIQDPELRKLEDAGQRRHNCTSRSGADHTRENDFRTHRLSEQIEINSMLLLQVITLFLVSVAMGLALAHALEFPGKMRLDRKHYISTQAIYYPGFTVVGGVWRRYRNPCDNPPRAANPP